MNLNDMINNLLESASDEGCSDDLVVIEKNTLEPFTALQRTRKENIDPECTSLVPSFYTVAFGSAFDGIVMEGLFTDMDSAIEYAETYAGESDWDVVPIIIAH